MPAVLKEITKYKANNGGLYALSLDMPEDPDRPFQMKVGRTVNYKKRLNDYHLCYNAGYRVIALLPLKNTCPKNLRLPRSTELEKLCHEMLRPYKVSYPNRASRGSEWYNISTNHIRKVFKQLHKEYKNEKYELTAYPLLKFEDDYLNKFDTYSDKVKSFKLKSSTPAKIKISTRASVRKVIPKPIIPKKPKKKINLSNMKKVSKLKNIIK